MGPTSGINGGAAGQWYRVQALSSDAVGGSPHVDYAAILPAALNSVRHRRPFIAGWLSRGGGAPLELITNAGPLPPASRPVREEPAASPVADQAEPGPKPTQPPATQPPATQPPATQPPATQPPVTQPPATQPPATQPPATQPP